MMVFPPGRSRTLQGWTSTGKRSAAQTSAPQKSCRSLLLCSAQGPSSSGFTPRHTRQVSRSRTSVNVRRVERRLCLFLQELHVAVMTIALSVFKGSLKH